MNVVSFCLNNSFFMSYPNSQFAQSMTYIQLPPANKVAKVMFSIMSVCQSVYPQVRVSLFRTMAPSSSVHNPRPGPHLYRALTPAPGHVQLGLHCPAPDMFKFVHYKSMDCRKAGHWHSTEMPSCIL